MLRGERQAMSEGQSIISHVRGQARKRTRRQAMSEGQFIISHVRGQARKRTRRQAMSEGTGEGTGKEKDKEKMKLRTLEKDNKEATMLEPQSQKCSYDPSFCAIATGRAEPSQCLTQQNESKGSGGAAYSNGSRVMSGHRSSIASDTQPWASMQLAKHGVSRYMNAQRSTACL
eukprot:885606-Pelagomonas_calceolata.AAC.1